MAKNQAAMDLMSWTKLELSKLLQVDADDLEELAGYVTSMEDEADLTGYLISMIGEGEPLERFLKKYKKRARKQHAAEQEATRKRHEQIKQEYLRRAAEAQRQKANSRPQKQRGAAGGGGGARGGGRGMGGMGAAGGGRFGGRGGGGGAGGGGAGGPPGENVAIPLSAWSGEGEVCQCQATAHALVTNCLTCGKVICEVEANLPCTFCKTPHGTARCLTPDEMAALGMVADGIGRRRPQQQRRGGGRGGGGGGAAGGAAGGRRGGGSGGYDDKGAVKTADADALAAAKQQVKRLVGFDRNMAERTRIYDDQSDYFSDSHSKWLDSEEKSAAAARDATQRDKMHGARRPMKVAFDMAGRFRMVEDTGDGDDDDKDAGDYIKRGRRKAGTKAGAAEDGEEAEQSAGPGDVTAWAALPSSRTVGAGADDGGIVDKGMAKVDKIYKMIRKELTATGRASRRRGMGVAGLGNAGAVAWDFPLGSRRLQSDPLAGGRIEDAPAASGDVCLVLDQPMASLLVLGFKRFVPMLMASPHRGRVWVFSSGKEVDGGGGGGGSGAGEAAVGAAAAGRQPAKAAAIQAVEASYAQMYPQADRPAFPSSYPAAALVGAVDVDRCLTQEEYRRLVLDATAAQEYNAPYLLMVTAHHAVAPGPALLLPPLLPSAADDGVSSAGAAAGATAAVTADGSSRNGGTRSGGGGSSSRSKDEHRLCVQRVAALPAGGDVVHPLPQVLQPVCDGAALEPVSMEWHTHSTLGGDDAGGAAAGGSGGGGDGLKGGSGRGRAPGAAVAAAAPVDIYPVDGRARMRALEAAQQRRDLAFAVNPAQAVRKIRPGMVLLKGVLKLPMQSKIVDDARALGIGGGSDGEGGGGGGGGFYVPGFDDGAKMNVAMMCLGKHWNAQRGQYEQFRTDHDGKPVAPVPDSWRGLVDGVMEQAAAADQTVLGGGGSSSNSSSNSSSSSSSSSSGPFNPDLCIVNFYSSDQGKMGLHQDKHESAGSLARGRPVVSLSVGASAEFRFCDVRPEPAAGSGETQAEAEARPGACSSIRLDSGDALVFGGAARHIFHGIARVFPRSAPAQVPLRAGGRLNLTFREF